MTEMNELIGAAGVSDWRKTSDEPPEADVEVLVWFPSEGKRLIGQLWEAKELRQGYVLRGWHGSGWSRRFEHGTHWMPLPASPGGA